MTVNTFGRPREYDRIQIGMEFIKFTRDHPECLTVPMYTVTKDGLSTDMLRNWAQTDEDFRSLYKEAKEQIGVNRLKMTLSDSPVKLDTGIYRQTIAHFDPDTKAEIREEKQFEANITTEDPFSKDGVEKLDKFMKFLESTQSSSLNIPESNINKEQ